MEKSSKLYMFNSGLLVRATKSAGGLFYDVEVVETGFKASCLAQVFEELAKPVEEKDVRPGT